MAGKKAVQITISQEMFEKIVPSTKDKVAELEFRKKCEEEYEKSKRAIMDVMKKNTEKYENQ